MAGPPALHVSEPGQVRKEAAKAIPCKCRGPGSPPEFCCAVMMMAHQRLRTEPIVNKMKFVIAAMLIAASPAVSALDGLALEFGRSDSTNSSVNLYRVNAQWDWKKRLVEMGRVHIGGYWETTFGYWDNNSAAKSHDAIFDVGITPVFRLQPNNLSGFSAYAELAVGFHLLSRTSVSPQRQFGSAFQFGDHVGAGLRFGEKGQFDLGYRYQHLSNAGIKGPNQGINFHQIRLQYHFE
jgi:lipid A 3-O-deacylase